MQKRKNTTHSVVDRELYLIPSRMFERVIFYMQDRFWDGKEPIGLIKTQNHNLNITYFVFSFTFPHDYSALCPT